MNTDMAAAPPQTREAFLDHLRFTVVGLVIVLHASITYMTSPPAWWYVIDPQNSRVFTGLVLVIDVPIMLILFFIAGFFAYPSLARRTPAAFVRDKLVRLGLPWIFGVVFLAPPVTYLIYLTRGVTVPYLQFWLVDFWGPMYQQSVYWFLGILLLLFAGLALLYHSEAGVRQMERRTETPAPALFVKFWAFTTLWFFVASLVATPDGWANSVRLFVFQPARLLLYAGYFWLGIYADRRGWLRPGGYTPSLGRWLTAALLSGAAYLAWRLAFPMEAVATGLGLTLTAALFNLFCLSALLAGLALFQRYAGRPNGLSASLARNAYGIYYLHPLVLYPLAYGLLAWPASIALKAITLVAVTLAITWAASALVLTRVAGLRRLF